MLHPEPPAPARNTRLQLHSRFYLSALIILVVGVFSALAIYFNAPDDSQDIDAQMGDTKQYEMQLERFGGQAEVMAVKFNHWLSSRWQGQPLAYTVAFIAIGLALLCFWVGHHIEEFADDEGNVPAQAPMAVSPPVESRKDMA